MKGIQKPEKIFNVNTQQDNFISACMSGVDPRTGFFNNSTTLFDYQSVVTDVRFSLVLNYNSKSAHVNNGYGYGFTDNLSRYDEEKKLLTLSSGQIYSISSDHDDEQPLLINFEHGCFTFTKKVMRGSDGMLSQKIYYIKHINGVVEKLENLDLYGDTHPCYVPSIIFMGVKSEIHLHWDYVENTPNLTLVEEYQPETNQYKHLLFFKDEVGGIKRKVIQVFKGTSWEYDIALTVNNKNQLVIIQNYGFDISGAYSWKFSYSDITGEEYLLNEIRYPSGRKDTVVYARSDNDFNTGLPDDIKLFTVSTYSITPQFISGVKEVITQYTFKGGGVDDRYLSTEEYLNARRGVIKKITRTYNKFHLLVTENIEAGAATTATSYIYNDCDERKTLAEQSIKYQCINQVKVLFTDGSRENNNQRHEVVNMAYDERCNLIRQENNDNSMVLFEYTNRIPFKNVIIYIPNNRKIISSTKVIYPGNSESNIYKEYAYELISKSAGGIEDFEDIIPYKIVPTDEKLFINNTLVKTVSFKYYKSSQAKMKLGKLRSCTVQFFDRKIVKDFTWTNEGNQLALSTRTKNNNYITEEVIIWEGITGLIISTLDSLYRKTEYTRDKIGRILSMILISNVEDESKSKKFQCFYKYNVNLVAGVLFYEKTTIDLHNHKIIERYDGLGRLSCIAMQKNKSTEVKIIHIYNYNELSMLVYEAHFSYKDDQTFSFITNYDYDDWGYINKIRHNDGVEEHVVTDVISRIKTHFLINKSEVINKRSVEFDVNNEPVCYRKYFSDGKITAVKLERDFCGRLIKCRDESGNTTQYEYDIFDRANKTIFPDKSVIKKTFNKYTEQPLIEKIDFISANGKTYEIGSQVYDEFNRLVSSQAYGVLTRYGYSLNYPLPDEITFADGSRVFYKNDYGLQDKILSIEDGHLNLKKEFFYSDIDDSLIETKFINHDDVFIEKVIVDNVNSNLEIHTKFTHDNNAIDLIYKQKNFFNNDGIAKITDETNTDYQYIHDSYGRITDFYIGLVKTNIQYDKFSRISEIVEYDTNEKCITQFLYDEFSREIQRKIILYYDGGVADTQQTTLLLQVEYYENNLIKSRQIESVSKSSNTVIRREEFTYDIMNRVKRYKCTGDNPVKDRNKKGVKSISYSYDEVGNISVTDTVYVDNSTARLSFFYLINKPFLLSWVQDETSFQLISYEFNKLGFLINKTNIKKLDVGFRQKSDSSFYYDDFLYLSKVKVAISKNNNIHKTHIVEYAYGRYNKLFFRKTLVAGAKKEEVFTYRGYNDEIVHMIDFASPSNYKKINFLFGTARQGIIKTPKYTIKNKIISDSSASPVYTLTYKNDKYISSDYSTMGIYGYLPIKGLAAGISGNFYDEEAAGYFLGSRMYDPVNMRFTTPDELSPFGGGNINPYIYCNNNPVNSNDNTGYITNEYWKISIYVGASFSIASGIATLGTSIAMSSVMLSVFSLLEISTGVSAVISLQEHHEDFELMVNGIVSSVNLGMSVFYVTIRFRYTLSKNLNKIFDFNRTAKNLRALPVNQNRKKIRELNYLGKGITIFEDNYKNKPRINVYAHGKKFSLVETQRGKSGKLSEVNKIDAKGLDQLLRSTGGINYDNYAAIRIIACHSGDFGFFKSALGYNMHQVTGLPVKAFHGQITTFGYPPEILQSSFENFANDPHAMQNVHKQFISKFEVVHNANYSPRKFL